jgi:phosphoglycolate phosphatase-like HAD superfamily hydrolase
MVISQILISSYKAERPPARFPNAFLKTVLNGSAISDENTSVSADFSGLRALTYKTYIFGYDRTLADLTRGYRIAYSEAFRSFGMPYDEALEPEYFSTPVDEIFQRYHKGCTCMFRDFMTMLVTIYDREVKENSRILPDASPCIRKLYARGCSLGIITDSYEQHVHEVLRENGLTKMFSSVVGIERMAVRRPHPYSVGLCLQELGSEAASAAVVSADPLDIQTGNNAGTVTILVDRGGRGEEACSPDYVVDSLADVPLVP